MKSPSSNESSLAGGAMGTACDVPSGRGSASTTLRSSILSLRTSTPARRDREWSMSEAAASMGSSSSSNGTTGGSLQAGLVTPRILRGAGRRAL